MSRARNLARPMCAGLLAVGLSLAAPLAAQSELSTPELLPAGTVVMLGVDDLQAFADGYAATAFGRLFTDPAFGDLNAEIADGLAWTGAPIEETTGLGTEELLALFEGRLAVGVLELGPPKDDEKPAVGLVALIGLAEESEDEVLDVADRLAERLLEWLHAERPDETGVQKFEEREGVDVSLLALTDDGQDVELAYAVAERTLVVVFAGGGAIEQAHLDGILAALQGEGEDRLVDSAAFATSLLAGPAAPARIFGWVAVDPIVQSALAEQRAMQASVHEAFRSQGMEPPPRDTDLQDSFPEGLFGPLVMSLTADASGQRQGYEASWGDHRWITPIAGALVGGQSPSLAKILPPDVTSAVLADLDLAATYDAVLEVIAEEDPDAVREIVLGLAAAEAETGFHPRNDLMEALSGQFGFFTREPEGGADPNDPMAALGSYGLVVGLQDAEVMREFLDGLIRSQGMHVARTREVFEGFEVYSVPIFPGMGVQYAIAANTMILSLNPAMVHDVLRRFANEDLASLGTDADYLAARAEVPAQATFVIAMDAADSAESVLELPKLFLAIAAAQGGSPPKIPWGQTELGLDVVLARLEALMPDPSIVARFVDGFSISTLKLTGNGFSGESFTP